MPTIFQFSICFGGQKLSGTAAELKQNGVAEEQLAPWTAVPAILSASS